MVSKLTTLSMTTSTIVFASTGVFGGGGGPAASGSYPSKDKEALRK